MYNLKQMNTTRIPQNSTYNPTPTPSKYGGNLRYAGFQIIFNALITGQKQKDGGLLFVLLHTNLITRLC